MNGLRLSWILVGIFLWGLPTGFGLSFAMANISLDGGLHLGGQPAGAFGRNCVILLPLFTAAGVGLGITMGNLCERAVRK